MAPVAAAAAIFAGVLTVSLVIDYRKFLNRYKRVGHTRGAIYRTIALSPAWGFLTFEEWDGWTPRAITAALVLFFLFWFSFDGLYNVIRGEKWFFPGSEDGREDAKTDNFLQKLKPWQRVAVKVVGVLGSIAGYLVSR